MGQETLYEKALRLQNETAALGAEIEKEATECGTREAWEARIAANDATNLLGGVLVWLERDGRKVTKVEAL